MEGCRSIDVGPGLALGLQGGQTAMLGLKNRKGTPVSGGIAILHHHVHPRRHRDASRAATQAVERIHRTHMETRSRSQEVDDPAKRDEAVGGEQRSMEG